MQAIVSNTQEELIKQLIRETIATPEIQTNLQEANKDTIVMTEEYLSERLEQKIEDLKGIIASHWEEIITSQESVKEFKRRLAGFSGIKGSIRVVLRAVPGIVTVTGIVAGIVTAIVGVVAAGYSALDSSLVGLIGSNASLKDFYDNIKPYVAVAFVLSSVMFVLVSIVREISRSFAASRKEQGQISTEIEAMNAQIAFLNDKLKTSLLEEGIFPELRVLINDHIAPSYGRHLTLRTSPDLVEMINASFQIPTEANNKVLRLLRNMRGGSLGIAGSRGAGKTTLIWSFCNPGGVKVDEQPLLSLMVSAPVEYNAREFILYLFMSICHRVVQLKEKTSSKQKTSSAGASLLDEQISRGISLMRYIGVTVYQSKLFQVTAALAAFFGLLALIISVPPTSNGEFTEALRSLGLTGPLIVGLFLLMIGVSTYSWVFWRIGRRHLKRQVQRTAGARNWRVEWQPYMSMGQGAIGLSLAEEAEQWMREIRFQQGFSSGWSGTLKVPLPISIETGITSAASLSQLQLTMPEIIGGYRGFLSRVAAEYRVIIGIDELDKLESAEKAQRFLNEIKSIFGLEKCFYLVSVSENAMSSFERRGLPFRDEFDSTFDTIIEVDYLNLKLAKRLLQRRVIGLPVPFLCLCYCLSGGLARDLIRTCRNLLELAQEKAEGTQGLGNGTDLDTLTCTLVKTELRRKVHAISIAAKEIAVQPEINHFFAEVYKLEDLLRDDTKLHMDTFGGLFQSCVGLLTPNVSTSGQADGDDAKDLLKKRNELMTLRSELGTYLYYSLTLNSFFGNNLVTEKLMNAEENGDIEQLARARQFLSVNPGIAQVIVTDFRTKYGMEIPATLLENTSSPKVSANGSGKDRAPIPEQQTA